MKNSYAATSGTPTTRDLLIRDYGPAGTYGRAHAPIDLALPEGSPFEILYAFVDETPGSHSFGNMYAVVAYKPDGAFGERYFKIRFHVWKPRQLPAMANRLTDIQEFLRKGFDPNDTSCFA